MKNKVIRALKQYKMLEGTNEITVALSGGADSVALLSVLAELKNEFGFELYAAHLNHSIRGAEADGDEDFVREFCAKLGIELFCETADIPTIAKKEHKSLELAARDERYAFLERVSRGKIATAHTASDNLETVLFNLSRGAALRGLSGIPKVRGNIIRPLIFCTRREIEEYCREKGLKFRTDSTNSDVAYSRNRIRLRVVPELKKINPSIENTVSNACVLNEEDNDFLDNAANMAYADAKTNSRSGFGLSAEYLSKCHPSIRKRVIFKYYLETVKMPPDSFFVTEINELVLKKGGKTGLKYGFEAVVSKGVLVIKKSDGGKKTAEGFSYNINAENLSCDCPFVRFEKINFKKSEKINNLLLKNTFDYDKISGNLTVRSRLEGDKIKIAGRGVTKKLKKLLREAKIPTEKRGRISVVADDAGPILVEGFGVDERVKIDKQTKNAVKAEFLGCEQYEFIQRS